MPQELVGKMNCPLIYYDEVAISYDAEFCKIDDRRCEGTGCKVLKAIQEKRHIAPRDTKSFNKGQFVGP